MIVFDDWNGLCTHGMLLRVCRFFTYFTCSQFLFTPGAQDVRQEYMDVESQYMERKGSYDKVAVGLEIDKQNLEKECDSTQVRVSVVFSFVS